VRRVARAQAAEEAALQEVLLARRTRCAGLGRAAGRLFEREQPFEDVDRGVERGAHGAPLALAVPAAVLEPLAHQPLDDRRDVDAEVRAVGDGPPVDALLDLALPVGLAVVLPAGVLADRGDGVPDAIRRRVEAELAQLRERPRRGRPRLAGLAPV